MAADRQVDERLKATSKQMSLALFEDMADLGLPIDQSSREIGYQRNHLFTEITNVGVAARRFLDAAYFLIAQDSQATDSFDTDLNYFKWLMRYESRNLKHLRTVADECQNAKIRVSNTPPGQEPTEGEFWASVPLMSTVAWHRGRIRFRVPPELLPHIQDPQRSHWLSLRIATAFSRSLARAIYDRVLPSVPNGRTDWIPLDAVREWPGKMGANAAIFKYFKRDWLEPAVQEINEVADIELRYETRSESPGSKKIDRIRFVDLKRKETANAVLVNLSEASELYMTLHGEFALTAENFAEISENRSVWTDERIHQAIEYTRYKLERGKVTKSPAGYLMRALRENYRVSEAERKMVAVQNRLLVEERTQEQQKSALREVTESSLAGHEAAARERVKEEIRLGQAYFEAADLKTRKELVRTFLAAGLYGKLAVRRLQLERVVITEENILEVHPDFTPIFCQYVFSKRPKQLRPALAVVGS